MGNGVTFKEETTKEKLGKKFDLMMVKAARYALIAGISFGLFNLDHVDVFKLTEFAPLYDE